jgi:hypothetical protein
MKSIIDISGVLLVLAGVACLVVYELAVPSNSLLVTALVLEVAGILDYVFLGRLLQ